MNGITRVGLAGIQAGISQADQASTRIARSFSSDPNNEGVAALQDLSSAQRQVGASAKVVHVGQDLDKRILDIIA